MLSLAVLAYGRTGFSELAYLANMPQHHTHVYTTWRFQQIPNVRKVPPALILWRQSAQIPYLSGTVCTQQAAFSL